MLVHCFSAGRVGATWLAHRVLDDGLTVEAAVAEAKTIGLKKEDFIAKATDYVQRMKRRRINLEHEPMNKQSEGSSNMEILFLLAFVVVWFALQMWILPASACRRE